MAQDSSAASSTAVLEHKEVFDFTPEERDAWLKTGDMPVKEKPPVAESAPKPAAETSGKKPESGTGENRDKDRNWKELREARESADKRVKELETELAELRKPKPAESKAPETAKAEPAATAGLPKAPERPKRPRMSEHLNKDGALDSEKYEAALDKYEQDLAEYQPKLDAYNKARESFENWRKETTARTEKVNGTWKGIQEKGKELIPDWEQLQKTPEAQSLVMLGDPLERYCRDLGDEGRPDIAARMVEYLLRKPADFKRITGLSAKKQMEEYAALEVAILDELSGKTKKEEKEEKPERKLTNAGRPPIEPTGGSASPDDDGSPEAAFKRKDLTQEKRGELYRERQNKLEIERRKASRGRRQG